MRIAMISPLEMRVPPVGYGGTELVVSLLTEELVTRGHDVTLFASGDSETTATLVPGCTEFLRGKGRDAALLTNLNALTCIERAMDFDIIHNHTLEAMAYAGFTSTPMLTTLHGHLTPDQELLFCYYKGWHNAISYSARDLLMPKERLFGVIYHGLDLETYPYNPGPRGEHMLFLSRMTDEKGPHLAIEVAKRLGRRLIMAGNVHAPDRAFFEECVLPEVDGNLIQYVGEADYYQKRELMSGAMCLLAPIKWEEPFGLFMIEAMACGTPVIAMRRGAAPEVVHDGRSGFLANNVEQMVEAVERVPELSAEECRLHVQRRFNVARMADDYLAAYQHIIEQNAVTA